MFLSFGFSWVIFENYRFSMGSSEAAELWGLNQSPESSEPLWLSSISILLTRYLVAASGCKWCENSFFFGISSVNKVESEFCGVSYVTGVTSKFGFESGLQSGWLVGPISVGDLMNDRWAFAAAHSWDTDSAALLISHSHPGCRASVGVRNRRRWTRRSTKRRKWKTRSWSRENGRLQSGAETGGIASQSATCARRRADDREKSEEGAKKEWGWRQRAAVIHRQASRHMAAVCRALGGSQEPCLVTRWCCMSRPSRATRTPGSRKQFSSFSIELVCTPDSWNIHRSVKNVKNSTYCTSV